MAYEIYFLGLSMELGILRKRKSTAASIKIHMSCIEQSDAYLRVTVPHGCDGRPLPRRAHPAAGCVSPATRRLGTGTPSSSPYSSCSSFPEVNR